MARKVVSRMDRRLAAEAAERSEGEAPAKKKATKASADGTAVKRKSRAKVPKEVRLKAFWGVFNQSLKRVAVFEYSQRSEADQKAAEMSTSQKTPHFVQLVKEPIAE